MADRNDRRNFALALAASAIIGGATWYLLFSGRYRQLGFIPFSDLIEGGLIFLFGLLFIRISWKAYRSYRYVLYSVALAGTGIGICIFGLILGINSVFITLDWWEIGTVIGWITVALLALSGILGIYGFIIRPRRRLNLFN